MGCGTLVLATNAWAANVRELHRRLVVVTSDMIATAAVPERLEEIGWTGGECISDSQIQIHYYHATRDGRVAFGKGGWGIALAGRINEGFDRNTRRAAEVERNFRRLYPALADVPIEYDWSGPIDRSGTGIPIFGHLGGREHIVYGVGWSGNGVAPSQIGGRILASLALGADDEWARCGLVDGKQGTFPPEPVRFLGAHVVREAVVRTERAHEAGRVPNARRARRGRPRTGGHHPEGRGDHGRDRLPASCRFRPIPSVVEMRTHDDTRSGSMQEFEVRYDGELPATPAAVWDAIARPRRGLAVADRLRAARGRRRARADVGRRHGDRLGPAAALRDAGRAARGRLVERARLPAGAGGAGTLVHYAHRGVLTGDDYDAAGRRLPRPHGLLLPLARPVRRALRRPRGDVRERRRRPPARRGRARSRRCATRSAWATAPSPETTCAWRRRGWSRSTASIDYAHGRVPRRAHGRRALPLLRPRRLGLAGGGRAPPLRAGRGPGARRRGLARLVGCGDRRHEERSLMPQYAVLIFERRPADQRRGHAARGDGGARASCRAADPEHGGRTVAASRSEPPDDRDVDPRRRRHRRAVHRDQGGAGGRLRDRGARPRPRHRAGKHDADHRTAASRCARCSGSRSDGS